MRVEFLKEYTARTTGGQTRTVPAGTVLDLSPDKAARLEAAGVALSLDAVLDAWRWFVVSADDVYRASLVSPAAWNKHKNHLKTARILFKTAGFASGRAELDQALMALQSFSGMTATGC